MKKVFRLGIIALLLAALVIIYFVLKNKPEPEPEPYVPVETEVITICRVEESEMEKITFSSANSNLVILNNGEEWSAELPYPMELNNSQIDSLHFVFRNLIAARLIEESPDSLDQFGLDNPQASAKLILKDETSITLYLGNVTPTGNRYYLKKEGEPEIYSIYSYNAKSMLTTLDSLRIRTLPLVDTTQISFFKLITEDETIELELGDGTENKYGIALSSFNVNKPFKPRPADSENLSEYFLTIPQQFQIIDFIDNVKDLSEYGLNPPEKELTIVSVDSGIELFIGKSVDDYIYAKLPEKDQVFTLAARDFEFVNVDPFTLADKFILIVNILNIKGFTLVLDGVTYTAEILRPDEDTEQFFINDKEVEDKKFRAIYQGVLYFLADAPNPGYKDSGVPEMTITYNLSDSLYNTVGMSLVPIDRDFYAAYRDGESEFLVSRFQVDNLRKTLEDELSD